jgi:hypothetical protein
MLAPTGITHGPGTGCGRRERNQKGCVRSVGRVWCCLLSLSGSERQSRPLNAWGRQPLAITIWVPPDAAKVSARRGARRCAWLTHGGMLWPRRRLNTPPGNYECASTSPQNRESIARLCFRRESLIVAGVFAHLAKDTAKGRKLVVEGRTLLDPLLRRYAKIQSAEWLQAHVVMEDGERDLTGHWSVWTEKDLAPVP